MGQFKFKCILLTLSLCTALLGTTHAVNSIDERSLSQNYGLVVLEGGEVSYDPKEHSYVIKFHDQSKSLEIPREEFEEFLVEAQSLAHESEWTEAKTLLQNHHQLLKITNPDLKEGVSETLDTMGLALEQVRAMGQKDRCQQTEVMVNTAPFLSLEQSSHHQSKYEFTLTSSGEEKIRRILERELKSNVQRIVLGLDEIHRASIEFESGNDNPLLGLSSASGFSQPDDLFEGDDRGKTMNQNINLGLYYNRGEIHLSKSYTGYGQIVTDPSSNNLDNSKTPQNFLSVDSLELQLTQKRETQNGVDYFTRLGLRQEKFSDDGVAKSIQENWHGMDPSFVQYDYLDHMETDRRYSAKLEIGKDFIIKENEDYQVNLSVAPGLQISNRDSAREVSLRGELKLRLKNGEFPNDLPKWEATLYVDGRQNREREKSLYAGAELSRRFQLEDSKNSVLISLGLSYDDDPIVRAYSEEEMERKGSLDLYHNFRLRFDRKF